MIVLLSLKWIVNIRIKSRKITHVYTCCSHEQYAHVARAHVGKLSALFLPASNRKKNSTPKSINLI